jgi:two-component system, OmpR family, response regulator
VVVTTFGWVAGLRDPPWQWDLRRLGWTLCHGHDGRRAECRHVLLADARELSQTIREGMAEADRPAWRLLMLGIEEPAERAALLTLGCAEALPAAVGLRELEARARRVDEMFGMLPRWRSLGPLTLDLFHRDARRGGRWLALHPREFGVLWRLADNPGQRVTRVQLLRDVWRLNHEPETNSVEVHISRLRGKLAEFGCEGLVATDPRGGYRLQADRPFLLDGEVAEEDSLDAYLRRNALWPTRAELQDG